MPIPASGPISMSMFNTVLGRASNTANSSLAGGNTPAVGSQFYLGGLSGSLNQTAPHAMSEWYSYTTCNCYEILNETFNTISYQYTACGGGSIDTSLAGGDNIHICSSTYPTVDAGGTIIPGSSCTQDGDCS